MNADIEITATFAKEEIELEVYEPGKVLSLQVFGTTFHGALNDLYRQLSAFAAGRYPDLPERSVRVAIVATMLSYIGQFDFWCRGAKEDRQPQENRHVFEATVPLRWPEVEKEISGCRTFPRGAWVEPTAREVKL